MQSDLSGSSSSSVRLLQSHPKRPPAGSSNNIGHGSSVDDRTRAAAAKYRALIVGRDRMSADLLASALNQTPACDAAAVPPDRLAEMLAVRKTHLVVISEELGDRRSGFDLTANTLQAYPNLVVVILLSHPSQIAVVNAFRAGARGVFSRERPIGEFLDCIEHVRRGYLWAGPQEADVLLHVLRESPGTKPEHGSQCSSADQSGASGRPVRRNREDEPADRSDAPPE